MSSKVYDDIKLYLDDEDYNLTKLQKYDIIIDGLTDAAEKAAVSGHIEEYRLDDGQSQIKTIYRTVDQIVKAIEGFEKLRQMHINRLNGRIVLLRDSRGMRYNNI